MFEKLGAANGAEEVRQFLSWIDHTLVEMGNLAPPHLDESDGDGEFLETVLLVMCINCSRSDRSTESEPRV